MDRKFYMNKKEVSVFHVFPIARLGNVFPKSGVLPMAITKNGPAVYPISEAGEFCRIHENGDAFLFDGAEWVRIVLDSFDFVSRKHW